MAISEKEYMKMLTDMQDSNNKLAYQLTFSYILSLI